MTPQLSLLIIVSISVTLLAYLIIVLIKNREKNKKAEQLFQHAERLSEQKFYIKAIDSYNKFVQRYPDSKLIPDVKAQMVNAHVALGEMWILQKNYVKALMNYELALEKTTDRTREAEIYCEIGRTYYKQGTYQNAIGTYKVLIQLHPESELVSAANRGIADCDKQIKKIIREKEAEHLFQQAETLYEKGDYEKAIASYKTVVKAYDDSTLIPRVKGRIDDCHLRIETITRKKEAERSFQEAETLYEQGDYEKAIASYNIVVKTHDDSDLIPRVESRIDDCHLRIEMNRMKKVEHLFQEAETFYEKRQYENAIDSYNIVRQSYPQSKLIGAAERGIADCRQQIKRAEEAENSFQEAETLYEQGQYEDAITLYDSIIKKYPQSRWISDAERGIDDCRQEIKRAEEAERLFLEAETLYEQGDYEGAIKLYDTVIKKYPQSRWIPDAERGIADCRQEIKRADEAKRLFDEAKTLYEKGDYEKAFASYNRLYNALLEASPESDLIAKAKLGIANCHFELRVWDKAAVAYESIINEHGDATDIIPYCSYQIGTSCYRFGIQQKEAGKLEQSTAPLEMALVWYRHTMETFPKEEIVPYAHYGTIRTLKELGRTQELMKMVQAFIDRYEPEEKFRPLIDKILPYLIENKRRELTTILSKILENKQHELVVKVRRLFEAAETLYGQADYEGAIPKYIEALEEAGRHGIDTTAINRDFATRVPYRIAIYYYHIAGDSRNEKHYKTALHYIHKIPSITRLTKKEQAELRYFWGDILYSIEQFVRAIPKFKELIKKFPNSRFVSNAWDGIGKSHYELKNYRAARRAFKTLLYRFPDYKSKHLVQFNIAESFLKEDEYSQAYLEFEKLTPEAPITIFQTPPELQAQAICKSAYCLLHLGRDNKAIARYTDCIRQFPESKYVSDAYEGLGDIYKKRGDIYEWRKANDEAKEAYDKALENYGAALEHTDVPIRKHEIQAKIDKVKTKIEALEEVAFIDLVPIIDDTDMPPDENDTPDSIAQAFLDELAYDKAYQAFEEIARGASQDEPGLREKALYKAAYCIHHLGRDTEAIARYTECIKQFSERQLESKYVAHAYAGLGDIYASQENFDKAKENYDKALEADKKAYPATSQSHLPVDKILEYQRKFKTDERKRQASVVLRHDVAVMATNPEWQIAKSLFRSTTLDESALISAGAESHLQNWAVSQDFQSFIADWKKFHFQHVAPTSSQAGRLQPQDIAEKSLRSTVLVVNKNADGKATDFGSGFFICDNYIVSQWSIIEGAATAHALQADEGRTYNIEGITAKNVSQGLVILKVSESSTPLPLGNSDALRIAEPIYAIGNPKGWTGNLSTGKISAFQSPQKAKRIQISAPVSPGSSGGALLNNKGEVVGIVYRGYSATGEQNPARVIPINYLKALLTR